MKGKLLKDYSINTNDFIYKQGELVEVIELDSLPNSYAIYHNLPECNILDWIPKNIIELEQYLWR